MVGSRYTEAQAKATQKYNNKTYKTYNLRLRRVDDADIIESIEQAKQEGKPIREWLCGVYRK